MTHEPKRYVAKPAKPPLVVNAEARDLIERRTAAFMNIRRPMHVILQEVYLQGMQDAIDVLENLNER